MIQSFYDPVPVDGLSRFSVFRDPLQNLFLFSCPYDIRNFNSISGRHIRHGDMF